MPENLLDLAQIEDRINIVRENLSEAIEQAAAISGAAGEELYAERIANQDAELTRLVTLRDELLKLTADQKT